eukprot:6212496-Pleurochrysis_carterae.AAC.5
MGAEQYADQTDYLQDYCCPPPPAGEQSKTSAREFMISTKIWHGPSGRGAAARYGQVMWRGEGSAHSSILSSSLILAFCETDQHD